MEAGRETQLDLARARTLVASTEAALPALQSAVERAVFRLSTLTAQAPCALLEDLSVRTAMPALPIIDLAALPMGTPVQWLQRRPDIAQAERLLAAATSAEEAAQLARIRFEGGVTDFLAVLDAEREVLTNCDQLVQSQTNTATALVSVYRALGGGWAAPVAVTVKLEAP